MTKNKILFSALFLILVAGIFGFSFAHAQTASALQAEQVATNNYLANPSVTNKNILLSAMNTVNTQASTPGNTTLPNAQAIEQAANSAYYGTPAPAATVNSMNQSTAQSVAQQSTQTASVVAKGGSCAPATAGGTPPTCASGLECDNNKICNPTPLSGSVGSGGWCGSNAAACMGGLVCNSSHICAAAAPVTTGVSTAPSSGNFVPLTNLPIFGSGNITTAPTLPAFFNALYKYCIGIAATLAVIQIMHAGILYMGGGSVTETKQAKDLIAHSVLGLVLVLSPVIVFGIINPSILNMNIGLSGLNTGTSNTTAPTLSASMAAAQGDGTCSVDCAAGYTCQNKQCVVAAQPAGACTPISSGTILTTPQQQACCVAQKGFAVQMGTVNPQTLTASSVCNNVGS